MDFGPIREALFPGQAERDEAFRQEILRTSHNGLGISGAAVVGITLFLSLGRVLLVRQSISVYEFIGESVILLTVGISALWAYSQAWSYERSRLLTLLAGLAVGIVSIGFSAHLAHLHPVFQEYVSGQAALVVLGLVAASPLLPYQAFLVGLILGIWYIVFPGSAVETPNVLFIAMITLLGTAMAAVLYRQRHQSYEAFLMVVRATADVRETQVRLLLSEHAASTSRLTAALSHELNSPVGALQSSVDTLLLLTTRQAASPTPESSERMIRLQADLRRSIKDSANRLREIVSRIQRFSNLDRAEIQPTDLNEVVRDVAALTQSQAGVPKDIELDLQVLSPYSCRPAQISAALYTLVGNAANAINGSGRVKVSTRDAAGCREITIEDTGKGVSADDLPQIFDPAFKSSQGRVSTGNWSMFSARQIVREHGGDIEIRSREGQGTTVRVTLPGPGLV